MCYSVHVGPANCQLSREEQDKHPMPKRFWKGSELKDLAHFDMTRLGAPPMHTAVKFRSWDDERSKRWRDSMRVYTDRQDMA